MTPAMLQNLYSHLYGSAALPALEELFKSELEMHPSRREALFKIVQTDRELWQSSELHDLPLFSSITEGSEYSFDRGKQGASKTLSVVKYGLGFSISEEMVDDGKFDLIADMVKKLAKSARESQEIQAMNIFNNGFSTETTADAVSVFNSAHTLPSGGTFRNVLSTAADLSVTSLDTMLSDFETQFVGDSGIVYNLRPMALVCHSSLKRYASELVGSSQKPDTADNNLNSFGMDNLKVISSPHLSDTDAWFLVSQPMDNGLRIVSRKPIETMACGPDLGFSTDSIYYKARYREIIGAIHPYGVFGTAGA